MRQTLLTEYFTVRRHAREGQRDPVNGQGHFQQWADSWADFREEMLSTDIDDLQRLFEAADAEARRLGLIA